VSSNFGGSDYWVVKLDGDGELLWENTYGGSGSEWVWNIDLTDDDGFIVCGRSNSSDGLVTDSRGNRDFWIVKTNSNGDVEWTNSFGGTSGEVAYAVHQTPVGGYMIAGYSESDDIDVIDNYGDWDYWVIKISPREIIVDLGADTTLCTGETLQLSDLKPGASYLWQDGSVDSIFEVNTEGLYSLELHLDDCIVYDSIYVSYIDAEVADLGNDTSFCFQENELYLLNATVQNANSYLWQDGSTDSTFIVSFSGNYSVEVDINGCKSKDSVIISFNNPIVNIGKDTFICEEPFSLKATRYDDANYLWQNGATDQWIIVQDTGTYSVIVDVNGCLGYDTIQIEKCKRLRDPCFEIPNAFTNNGDGINDLFKPVNFCPLDNYRLTIFNRWGQIIFETENPDTAWDGFYKGNRAQQGVYAYIIEYDYTFEGGSINEVEKGTVLMMR
jgi:gliding motility-associated-like protein